MNDLAKKIHEATGWEGHQLEMATHLVMMLHSDILGHVAIGQYFEQRMREAYFKLQGVI